VGKSTLMRALGPDLQINFANESTYLDYLRDPGRLEALIRGERPSSILIDEVQRLPSILNTVQALLDDHPNLRFLLTGSSARKLRRGGANLLPGRVHTYRLGPLCALELGYEVDTASALATGTLPGIYLEPDAAMRRKTLRSYCATYLKEEVQAEALTKNLEGFARFLDLASVHAGNYLDLSKLASHAGLPRQTAGRFFEILEDTLIVQRCEAFSKSERRRLVQHPRYFFFDGGVLNGVLGLFEVSPDRQGRLFEHLIFNQMLHSASALDLDIRITSYRSSGGAEVDFILEKEREIFAIEAKASRKIDASDLRGFTSFKEFYGKPVRTLVAYLGDERRKMGDVEILPWQQMLREVGF
jgi:predicted AAA+ superfamily ATPase